MNRILTTLLLTGLCLSSLHSFSQLQEDTAYRKMVTQRAWKIVQPLKLKDSIAGIRVRDIIAEQYVNLNDVYKKRDRKESISTDSVVTALHQAYLQQLKVYLNDNQIVQVKNGMTYGVLTITYAAYQEMLPNLTGTQKAQIMSWLSEAREKAMDAESSEKKHGWFKKYKGRINNYLSAAGIDMKKEGEAWQQRIKAKAAQTPE